MSATSADDKRISASHVTGRQGKFIDANILLLKSAYIEIEIGLNKINNTTMEKSATHARATSQLRKTASPGRKKSRRQNSSDALPSSDEIKRALKELSRINKLAKKLKRGVLAASASIGGEDFKNVLGRINSNEDKLHGGRNTAPVPASDSSVPQPLPASALNNSTVPSIKDRSGTSFDRPALVGSFVQTSRPRAGRTQTSADNGPDSNQNALKIWLGDDITPIHTRRKKKKKKVTSSRKASTKRTRSKRRTKSPARAETALLGPSVWSSPGKNLSGTEHSSGINRAASELATRPPPQSQFSQSSLGNYSALKSPEVLSTLGTKTFTLSKGDVQSAADAKSQPSLNTYQSLVMAAKEEKGTVKKLKGKVYRNRKSAAGKTPLCGLSEIHRLREAEGRAASRIQRLWWAYIKRKDPRIFDRLRGKKLKQSQEQPQQKNKKLEIGKGRKKSAGRANVVSVRLKDKPGPVANTKMLEDLLKEKIELRKRRSARRKSGSKAETVAKAEAPAPEDAKSEEKKEASDPKPNPGPKEKHKPSPLRIDLVQDQSVESRALQSSESKNSAGKSSSRLAPKSAHTGDTPPSKALGTPLARSDSDREHRGKGKPPAAVDAARKKLLSDTLTDNNRNNNSPPREDTSQTPTTEGKLQNAKELKMAALSKARLGIAEQRSFAVRKPKQSSFARGNESGYLRASTNRENTAEDRPETGTRPEIEDLQRPRRYTLQVPLPNGYMAPRPAKPEPSPGAEAGSIQEESGSESEEDEDASLKVIVKHKGRCVKWNMIFPFEEGEAEDSYEQTQNGEDPEKIQTEILAFVLGKNDVVAYKPLSFGRIPFIDAAQFDISKWSHIAVLMTNCQNIFGSLSKSAPVFNIPTYGQSSPDSESESNPFRSSGEVQNQPPDAAAATSVPEEKKVEEHKDADPSELPAAGEDAGLVDDFVSRNHVGAGSVTEQVIDGIIKALTNIERTYPRCAADFEALAQVSEAATEELAQCLENNKGRQLGARFFINKFAMEMIEDCLRDITHLFILIKHVNGWKMKLTKSYAGEMSNVPRDEVVRLYLSSQDPIWGNVQRAPPQPRVTPKLELREQPSFRLNLNQSGSRPNSESATLRRQQLLLQQQQRQTADPAIVPHRDLPLRRDPTNEEDALELSAGENARDEPADNGNTNISVGESADYKNLLEPMQESAKDSGERSSEKDSRDEEKCERNTFLSELERRPQLEGVIATSVQSAYPFYTE